MRAIDRWRRLSASEKRLTLSAAPALAASAARLRLGGLRAALRWAEPPLPPSRSGRAASLAAAVDRAGRYLPGTTCLSKSLALARLLRKEGVDARVRVGVAVGDGFSAHAWVEVNGSDLRNDLDLELGRHVPMDLDRDR